jgi:hypothetical protein
MDKVTAANLAKREGAGKEAKTDEPGEAKPPKTDGKEKE